MTKTNVLLSLALLAALCGCGKTEKAADKAPAPTDTPKPAKPSPPAAKPGPDFAAWDMAGKKAAWQGSWVVKENGSFEAWTIEGDKVRTWDGAAESTFTLELVAPCRVYFKNDKGMMYPRDFAVVDGKLRKRSGGAGFRKGPEAIFCDMAGDIYTLDAGGKCVLWTKKFGDFEKGDGECGFKKNADGAEVFFHKGVNEGEFSLEGDAILSRSSVETEGAADYAAAKTLRDAKAAAK